MTYAITRISGILFALFFAIPAFSQKEEIILNVSGNKKALIYYESYGTGFPVILLHRSSAGYLEPIFSEREKFRRIYIDPPGIGNSGSEEWISNADDCFEIVKQAIDSIVPNGVFAIGGFSYFGYLSKAIAESNPSRINGLLLICPVTETNFTERSLPKHFISYTDSAFYQSLTEKQQGILDGLAIKNKESYHAIKAFTNNKVTLDTTLWNRIKRNNYSITRQFNSAVIEAPVLLFLGLQDNVVGYKDALSLIDIYPSISVVLADYASHSLPYEQLELLKQNVNLWLDRILIYEQRH